MGFLATWLVLAAFWLAFSGHFDATHLIFGFVSVTLVSALSHRHFHAGRPVLPAVARLLRLFAYAPWLTLQIARANWDVLLRVLGVRPVEPVIFVTRTGLESDFGRVTMANSITLTPGTVTIDVQGGEVLVHAIALDPAEGALGTGAMARRVRWVETGSWR